MQIKLYLNLNGFMGWLHIYSLNTFFGVGKHDPHANGYRCARYHQETSSPDYHLIEGSRCQVKSPVWQYLISSLIIIILCPHNHVCFPELGFLLCMSFLEFHVWCFFIFFMHSICSVIIALCSICSLCLIHSDYLFLPATSGDQLSTCVVPWIFCPQVNYFKEEFSFCT